MSSPIIKKIEQMILAMVQEYDQKFFYSRISRTFDAEGYKVKIDKNERDMTGKAIILHPSGEKSEYDVRYNRIISLNGERYSIYTKGYRANAVSQ